MDQKRCNIKFFIAVLLGILYLGGILPIIHAGDAPNTITFDNQSGEPALVKVIGPTATAVEVPNEVSRSINAIAGQYYILVRYGDEPEKYRYYKGDPFAVRQTETQYSVNTITLHKVIDGNYRTHPISSDEFYKN